MIKELKIENKIINDQSEAFVIAEIGHNHQGNPETCLKMIKAAKDAGCDAVKLQKRNNKKLYTKDFYNSPYENENSYGKTYGEHREALEFGIESYREFIKYASELEIIFFATPFDFESADFLQYLGVPCFKTASGDLTNIPLLKHIAAFNKPMFISTGGSTLGDVLRAYDAISEINDQICLMQCTAGYPVMDYGEMNLNVIKFYRDKFDCVVGLSDHNPGISTALAAFVLGARVIEKHFTLKRFWKGTDQSFSLEPAWMYRLTRDLKRIRLSMGDGVKRIYESEKKPISKMAKGLYAAKNLRAGDELMQDDIAIKSPQNKMYPYQIDRLIGKTLLFDMKEDEPFALDLIRNDYE